MPGEWILETQNQIRTDNNLVLIRGGYLDLEVRGGYIDYNWARAACPYASPSIHKSETLSIWKSPIPVDIEKSGFFWKFGVAIKKLR